VESLFASARQTAAWDSKGLSPERRLTFAIRSEAESFSLRTSATQTAMWVSSTGMKSNASHPRAGGDAHTGLS